MTAGSLRRVGRSLGFAAAEEGFPLYLYGVGATVKLVFLRGGSEYLVAGYTIEERPAWAKRR